MKSPSFKSLQTRVLNNVYNSGLGIRSFNPKSERPTRPNAVFSVKSDWSDLLFMKELFTLFKSDSLQIRSYRHVLAFYAQNKRVNRSSSLFLLLVNKGITGALLKRAKRGFHSWHKKPKSQFPTLI